MKLFTEGVDETFYLPWGVEKVAHSSSHRLEFCRIEEKSTKVQFLQSVHCLGEGQPASERVRAVIRGEADGSSLQLHGRTARRFQDLISVSEAQ